MPRTAPITPEQLEARRASDRKRKQDQRDRDRAARENNVEDFHDLSVEIKTKMLVQSEWKRNWSKLTAEQKIAVNEHIQKMDGIDLMIREFCDHVRSQQPITYEDATYFLEVAKEANELAAKYPVATDRAYIGFQNSMKDLDFTSFDLKKQPRFFREFGVPVDHIGIVYNDLLDLMRRTKSQLIETVQAGFHG